MIEVRNLTKIYRPKNGAEVKALNGVNLQFADSGLVFLLGKSGSGKSTLLNLMGGLDSYTSGDIIIKGKSSADFKQSDFDSYRNTYIGFIFQEFNILEEYSVGKNIGLALELQHKPADDYAITSILKQVDLDGYKDRKPNELSGGQKQRVAIARALIKSPEVIMGDEPTGSLDSKTGKQVFETLKRLATDKLVVVVSHDRENAELYGDRVIELADGEVISDRIRSKDGGKLESQPIKYISADLVKIEGGYQLTPDDVSRINQMLLKTRGEVFISADSGISDHIKEAKNITEQVANFVPTTPENHRVKKYSEGDFGLVRSKLPFRDAFMMGASGLKLKKVRLVFTILLSLVAFFLFGFSLVASSINSAQTEMRTFFEQGGKSILITSEGGERYAGGAWWSSQNASGISNEQIAEIEDIVDKPLLRIMHKKWAYSSSFDYFSLNYPLNVKSQELRAVYYSSHIEYCVETPSADAAGLTPAPSAEASRIPTAFNEIAITDYLADTFIRYGYNEVQMDPIGGTTLISHEVTNYGDLIGKTLTDTGYGDFVITGVYNTGYDMREFDSLKSEIEGQGMGMFVAASFTRMPFGMGYVAVGATDHWIQSSSPKEEGLFIRDKSAYIVANYHGEPEDTGLIIGNFFLAEPAICSNVYWLNGKTAQTLSENDVILSSSLFPYDEAEDFATAIENMLAYHNLDGKLYLTVNGEEKVLNIAGIHDFHSVMNPYAQNGLYMNNDLYSAYKAIRDYDTPLQLNNYGVGDFSAAQMHTNQVFWLYRYRKSSTMAEFHLKPGYNAETLADDEVIVPWWVFIPENSAGVVDNFATAKALFTSLTASGDITCSIGKGTWGNDGYVIASKLFPDLKVVGIFDGGSDMVVSNYIYDAIASRQASTMSVLVPLSGDMNKDRALFEYVYNSEVWNGNYGDRLKLTTTLSPLLDMLSNTIPTLRLVFLYVSLGFSLFAALLLMNFIGVSIAHKKKDIGVLRAIGARSKDVFSIFFCESMIIGIINFVLAVVAVVTTAVVLNIVMGVVLFVPGVFQISMMFLLCFGIALVSTYFPVRKIARKKPIDAINNR